MFCSSRPDSYLELPFRNDVYNKIKEDGIKYEDISNECKKQFQDGFNDNIKLVFDKIKLLISLADCFNYFTLQGKKIKRRQKNEIKKGMFIWLSYLYRNFRLNSGNSCVEEDFNDLVAEKLRDGLDKAAKDYIESFKKDMAGNEKVSINDFLVAGKYKKKNYKKDGNMDIFTDAFYPLAIDKKTLEYVLAETDSFDGSNITEEFDESGKLVKKVDEFDAFVSSIDLCIKDIDEDCMKKIIDKIKDSLDSESNIIKYIISDGSAEKLFDGLKDFDCIIPIFSRLENIKSEKLVNGFFRKLYAKLDDNDNTVDTKNISEFFSRI